MAEQAVSIAVNMLVAVKLVAYLYSSDIHLHTNQEPGCAIDISHGGKCEHVPERLAALLVVQQPDCGFSGFLDGVPDVFNCFLVRVLALQKPDKPQVRFEKSTAFSKTLQHA